MLRKQDQEVWPLLEIWSQRYGVVQAGPVPLEEIAHAEDILDIKFSPGYKKFVQLYGSGVVQSYFIYGLKKPPHHSSSLWSVIDRTFYFRKGRPFFKEWCIISEKLPSRFLSMNHKGYIFLYEQEGDFKITRIAETFEEFILKILQN